MAINRKLKQIVSGVITDLHPITHKDNIYLNANKEELSQLSKNLMIQPAGDGFLKVGTDGSIVITKTPADFGSIEESHSHEKTEVNGVFTSVLSIVTTSLTTGTVEPTSLPNPTQLTWYLNTVSNTLYHFDGVEWSSPIATHIQDKLPSIKPRTIKYYTDLSRNILYKFTPQETTTLASFLGDLTEGKIPIVGGVIPGEYFPEYVEGHMSYKGTFPLAGSQQQDAVNISAVFPNMATSPLEQIGDFYVVSSEGWIEADGVVDSGTSFVSSNEEGPIFLEVGSRIVFVDYIAGTGEYKFALLTTKMVKALTNRTGTFTLADGQAKNRNELDDSSSDSDKTIDEYALREAMRDIVYEGNLTRISYLPAGFTGKIRVFKVVQSGEPNGSSNYTGTFSGSLSLGDIAILSDGRIFKHESQESSNHIFVYLGTMIRPNHQVGEMIMHGSEDLFYVAVSNTPNQIDYEHRTLLEGDILIS